LRRAARAKRRAMERMAKSESVNPMSVFIRDGWCCVYCGTTVRQYQANGYLSGDEATIDHVKPLALGGEHSYSNIVTACWDCNTKKQDSFYAE
jgi:5-methylcytosine-specific restriction endonuclease McrA